MPCPRNVWIRDKWMAVFTKHPMFTSTAAIFLMRYRFKVIRINAQFVSALMIYIKIIIDMTMSKNIRYPVGRSCLDAML